MNKFLQRITFVAAVTALLEILIFAKSKNNDKQRVLQAKVEVGHQVWDS